MERLIEWLPATTPADDSHRHRPRRLPARQHGPSIPTERKAWSAVLDWELSTLGNPLADFSYFLMQWSTQRDGAAGWRGST